VKQSQSMKRLVMITDNEKNATSQDMIWSQMMIWSQKNAIIASNDAIANNQKIATIATIGSDDMISKDPWMDHLKHNQWIIYSLQHNQWITFSVIDCRDAIKGMVRVGSIQEERLSYQLLLLQRIPSFITSTTANRKHPYTFRTLANGQSVR
jgi:hypothetical protein